MRNASAAVLEPSQAHTMNPERDFTAQYVNTRAGLNTGYITIDQIPALTAGRLSAMPDRAFVIIRGTIGAVRLFETPNRPYKPPTAMVRLESGTGAATYVHVTGQQYERIWGWLVYGRVVSVSGNVVRPEPAAPEYINLSRFLLAGSDVLTREQYLDQLAKQQTTEKAVTSR
ncbi:hypothetical protein HZZ00_37375 (plasmid) [Streptomyces sp. NEAU-sy36]|uniref:hypothetical protein n=1 Tax=unclassified Streptomyces TaxID=2593676 RepID=UPI0015D644F4|nr:MULTISPECIES: hypothetical protein [unclassified Streptomyces]QLJ06705.1 hypothetical protein HZZ00_37375 [Streptomyces sp. NEAU-sy36]